MRRALEIFVSAVLGVIVAIVGGIGHRSIPPLGVALSVALVLVSAIFVRTWGGWSAVIAFVVPLVALSFLFTRVGPGGSLLIAGDGLGYGWLYGASGAIVLACLVPAQMLGGGRHVSDA